MVGAGAYVTYTLNLWGPMLNMANAASSQALREAKKRLRDFLDAGETAGPGQGGAGLRAAAYEMKSLDGDGRRRAGVDEGPSEDDA